MKVVGIIAEYNPLHNGHIYHMEEARARSGADYVIVAMSGNFVQRGEPACADKYTRASWAVQCGADLVVELPSVYAVGSAERFALGGVRTLFSTGVITHLSFGCETADISKLYGLAELLVREPPAYKAALRRHLQAGKSYPRARYDALAETGAEQEMLDILNQPNNILALEYLRAIGLYDADVKPVPVSRIGNGYNEEQLTGEFSSATAIRAALQNGDRSVLNSMPSLVGGAMLYDPQFPLLPDCIGAECLYALRRMSVEELANLPDVTEGFEHVIARACRTCSTLNDFFETVKTKRFTMARCKRIAVSALLGISGDQVHSTVRSTDSEYLKVLAMKSEARALLSEMSRFPHAPVILRNSDALRCNAVIQQNLGTDALATDILAYATGLSFHRDTEGAIIL